MDGEHPIWRILREQGRYNLVWLAERTEYSHSHVKAMASGRWPCLARFRAACARLLEMDESALFHGAPYESAPEADAPTEAPNGRADTAVSGERTDAPEEAAIARMA